MSDNNWEPTPGDVIDNRYEVRSHLGEGGIAKVWEGYDQRTNEGVAIKHLRFDSDNYRRAKQTMEQMFRREIEALRGVQDAGGHPHIIELETATSVQGTQLAVVELVEGDELDDENLSVSVTEAREIARDLADAMAFLHRNEIILRDLKPDNAMIQSNGEPKLIDFNTAKEFDTTVTGTPTCPNCGRQLGTSDYVCPGCNEDLTGGMDTVVGSGARDTYKPPESTEDMAHLRQGPWSDVYSLGKILHYLLADDSAIPPKDGANPEDFNVSLRSSNEYLGEIVERATAEDYERRYSNANVFATVIENETPEPPQQARLVHDQTGRTYDISPGDTIGRQGAEGPAATITIDDPGDKNFISAVQVQLDTTGRDQWLLRDRSLNGTYVQNGNGWQRVLCEQGRRRLQNKGHDPTDRHGNVPPESLEINDGAVIKLVDTTYDVTFKFEEVA
ncbi:protein kinase [Halobaculum sp. MBLA0147]|uniref:protein kinase domain-containing protein n=1 Tax=Halobaculum sp. MBLA0147 TaxID=3079934 RepID=UPI0035252248